MNSVQSPPRLHTSTGCFILDSTGGPKFPASVPQAFIDEMTRIDSRLELRWSPSLDRFGVWIRLPETGALWSQPCHIIETSLGKYRLPDQRDLRAIRFACHMNKIRGTLAWVENMDKMVMEEEKRKKDRREGCQILC